MADSYHIINGQVVPFSGGRKCNDTDAWRDATPLELQLQEQLAESEHAIAAQAAEIEALRAEVERWKGQHMRDSAELRRLCQHRDEYKARADKLAEAVRGWWEEHRPVGWTEDQHRSCPHVNLATDAEKALATALLRDQKGGLSND